MPIPKIIHYCWFGGNPLPQEVVKCINSWKSSCPDFLIKEWNEHNFNVNVNNYTYEAYKAKKWAFATDYARLNILYDYGGIYLDTDVELTKSLDAFLEYKGFWGFENYSSLSTAIIGAEKGSEWLKKLMSIYDNLKFTKEDGAYDVTTNVERITSFTQRVLNLKMNNSFQILSGEIAVFPSDYFCAKNYDTGKILITKNTHAIHHFMASWHSSEENRIRKRNMFLLNYLGIKPGSAISNRINYTFFLLDLLKKLGIRMFMKKFFVRILYNIRVGFPELLDKLLERIIFSGIPVQNKIVFESEGDFSDNARALYDYMIDKKYNMKYKIIWFVENPAKYKKYKCNNNNVKFISRKSKNYFTHIGFLYHKSTAKFFFFTHPYWMKKWRNDQTVVNLWHGCGYKKIKDGTYKEKIFDYCIVVGEFYVDRFAKIFQCDKSKVIPLGYPRNDKLKSTSQRELITTMLPVYSNELVLLWMPTFRKAVRDELSSETLYSEIGLPIFTASKQLNDFNNILQKNKIVIVIKIHHLQDESSVRLIKSNSNIFVLNDDDFEEKNIQLYDFVSQTDALVTDYSSIAIDYLLLDRPIAYTLDDYELYNKVRGFTRNDTLNYMPGHHIYTLSDFENFICDLKCGLDPHKENRRLIRELIHAESTVPSCERILDYLHIRNQ